MKIYIVCINKNSWFRTQPNKVYIFYNKQDMNQFIVDHQADVVYWTCKRIKRGR